MPLLPYDIISVIYDYACNNFEFFFYILNNNLSPQKELTIDYLNWYTISKRKDLPFWFIEKYAYALNWRILTATYINNLDFFRQFKDDIEWCEVNKIMSLYEFEDYSFFDEFADYLDFDHISRWNGLCELFVDLFAHKLNWYVLSKFQGLTPYILEKYKDKLDLKALKNNKIIPKDVINLYVGDDEEETNESEIEDGEFLEKEEVDTQA